MEPDFSGYATKAGLKCSDGRTIMPEAFRDMDGKRVPLVWQHGHESPDNVLGHVLLEHRPDGVYAFAFFNDTKQGQNAKALVIHEDVNALSIWANKLVERAKNVYHGVIREVSLVLSGANPGALIDPISIKHSDGQVDTLDDEAIIYTGLTIEHKLIPNIITGGNNKVMPPANTGGNDNKTVNDVYNSLTPEQLFVVHYMIGVALDPKSITPTVHSDDPLKNDDLTHKDKEGKEGMPRNVFDSTKNDKDKPEEHMLSHEDIKGIMADAMRSGSLKDAVETYAVAHGITNIDILFPDARNVTGAPEFDKRRTEWVSGVINGTKHSPFSRIKTLSADLTFEDARAKGYIKGTLKKEEFFGVSKRVTTPTTVYKKQKLDRDDVIDITDFDVVTWIKGEMRVMLDEELARAVLIGDGRDSSDEDKIKDPAGASEGAGIRSIANDSELYAATVLININDASSSMVEVVDAIIDSRRFYKGTGTPTFYTTERYLTAMLLTRDTLGRRLWKNMAELADELRVAAIVTVEPMEDIDDLVGIIANLSDYTIGADNGGDVAMFDDFNIDYNKFIYLLETRVSGALTKIRSAVVVRKTAGSNVLVVPNIPTFVESTGVVTIVATTGVVYKNAVTNATLSTGAQAALAAGATLHVKAVAASGYYIANNIDDEWFFTRPAA